MAPQSKTRKISCARLCVLLVVLLAGQPSARVLAAGMKPFHTPSHLESCELSMSWRDIINLMQMEPQMAESGGLGKLMNEEYQVWVCTKCADTQCTQAHSCLGSGSIDSTLDILCWCFSEVDDSFAPWDLNSKLQLCPVDPAIDQSAPCGAGFTGPDGGQCSPCAPGTFKPGTGNEPCVQCPKYSNSTTAATGCNCNPGATPQNNSTISFEWAQLLTNNNAEDQQLVVGEGDTLEFTWGGDHNVYLLKDKAAFGSFGTYNGCDFTEAQELPDHETSGTAFSFAGRAGETLYFACRKTNHCEMGQKLAVTVAMSGTCKMCEAGKYKSSISSEACIDCPTGTTSQEGSIHLSGCTNPSTSNESTAEINNVNSGEFDFSSVTKSPHPGSGEEFKSLITIELKGGLDGAAAVVNVKNEEEVHLWCSKRPTLSAEEYCDCQTLTDDVCTLYVLKEEGVVLLNNTDGYLGMTDLLASGSTSWISLWEGGKMSIVPGLGREDHGRSHFEVMDAAAKGVSVELESETSNGWLGKSIFGYNNLFCKPTDEECPNPSTTVGPLLVDGISLAQAAAGPNALEVNAAISEHRTFNHLTGVEDVDAIAEAMGTDYVNPFMQQDSSNDQMRQEMGRWSSVRSVGQTATARHDANRKKFRTRQMTDEELWSTSQTNQGLEALLLKQAMIFQSLGILQSQIEEYNNNLPTVCPATDKHSGFPPIEEWADDDSEAEIGMQLRAVAILLANGVWPKVFQVQQRKFDTHSNQAARLQTLLADLKTGVYTFVKAAESCGFWKDILMTTFSDFGRRLEENSRKGTDHGWGSYHFAFGKDLRKPVFGYNPDTDSSDLKDIVPMHANSYRPEMGTKGDLQLTTRLETWNSCLLNALALPGLPRLGECPEDLKLRENLASVPVFDEKKYYAAESESSSSGSPSSGPSTSASNSNGTHLSTTLTRTQVLHFARRVGHSVQSLGLERYFISNVTHPVIGQNIPNLTLQKGISLALAPENTQLGYKGSPVRAPKIYNTYELRNPNNVLKLWSEERREKRNNWKDLLSLPYPRIDTIQLRLQQWGLEEFFDMASLSVDPVNEVEGSIVLKASHAGRGLEILDALQAHATVFFPGQPVNSAGETEDDLYNEDGTLVESNVNWYKTIMFAPRVLEISNLTFRNIVEDWMCDNSTARNPTNNMTCDPACDIRDYMTIDYEAETAMITDTSNKGWDGTWVTASWRLLKECIATSDGRKGIEQARASQLKSWVNKDLHDMYHSDMTDPKYGLRARMAWFFLNFYATPQSDVGDWLLMYKQYATVWHGALGNYRVLAHNMFADGALRASLDQLEEVECGSAPIENFAREFFERFTVGLKAHNEGDVKLLARGLMNCKEYTGTFNEDLTTPGIIFTDVNETLWTLTEEEQANVVDRILDFKSDPTEPPAAAQFLCDKMYHEFAILEDVAEDSMEASSIGFPPAVVECARYLYDHNYDITFALQHILEDKEHFFDTLGQKKRWPMSVVYEKITDYPSLYTSLNRGGMTSWLTAVGMEPFEAPDVSGWDLDTVWTSDRLTQAHDFLESKVTGPAKSETDTYDFQTKEDVQFRLAPFNLGPEYPNKYSYSVRLCGPGNFVEVRGKEGNQTIDVDELFDSGLNRAKRFLAWKTATEFAVPNVCQFVC